MNISINHPIELIFNEKDQFRKPRLEKVVYAATKNLCNEEILNILSVEDHKGKLTLIIYKNDESGNTEKAFEDAWEEENEYNFEVLEYQNPF